MKFLADDLSHGPGLARAEVVHDDDVVGLEDLLPHGVEIVCARHAPVGHTDRALHLLAALHVLAGPGPGCAPRRWRRGRPRN